MSRREQQQTIGDDKIKQKQKEISYSLNKTRKEEQDLLSINDKIVAGNLKLSSIRENLEEKIKNSNISFDVASKKLKKVLENLSKMEVLLVEKQNKLEETKEAQYIFETEARKNDGELQEYLFLKHNKLEKDYKKDIDKLVEIKNQLNVEVVELRKELNGLILEIESQTKIISNNKILIKNLLSDINNNESKLNVYKRNIKKQDETLNKNIEKIKDDENDLKILDQEKKDKEKSVKNLDKTLEEINNKEGIVLRSRKKMISKEEYLNKFELHLKKVFRKIGEDYIPFKG